MNHRELVMAALNHNIPDRIPVDFGSHPNGSIHKDAYDRLKIHLGIGGDTKLMHRWMQVAEVDEAILNYFNIDTRGLHIGKPNNSNEHELADGSYVDKWGIVRSKPEGAKHYELSKCPLGGDITISDIRCYHWPDPHNAGITRGLRKRASRLRHNTDYAINLTLPSPFVHTTQFLRSFQDWYIDCASRNKVLFYLWDTVLDINLSIVKDVLGEVGDLIDIVTVADDIGGQDRLSISPDMYRKFIKPRHERYFNTIHQLTQAKLLFHTCGSVFDVIDDFIDIGVDALNPVQVSAAKMDTFHLKNLFGSRISFWGAIDTHRVLPFGSTAEIHAEVERCIGTLGKNGGYVLGAVHNIQPEVPPENICTMFDASHTLGVCVEKK